MNSHPSPYKEFSRVKKLSWCLQRPKKLRVKHLGILLVWKFFKYHLLLLFLELFRNYSSWNLCSFTHFYKRCLLFKTILRVDFFLLFSLFFNTATSAAPLIPLCRRMMGSNQWQLRLRHWLSDALITRLNLIHPSLELLGVITIQLYFSSMWCKEPKKLLTSPLTLPLL